MLGRPTRRAPHVAASLGTLALLLTLAAPARARAQEAAPRPTASGTSGEAIEAAPHHPPVALHAHVGVLSGFGGGLQLGTAAAGIRASVGWAPLLFVLEEQGGGGTSYDLKFKSALLVSPDLYVRLWSPRPTTYIGAQAGYRYSSLLGHGAAVGGYVQFGVARPLDVLVSFGVMVFPDGEERLTADEHLVNPTYGFPGPAVNIGFSVGLLLFP